MKKIGYVTLCAMALLATNHVHAQQNTQEVGVPTEDVVFLDEESIPVYATEAGAESHVDEISDDVVATTTADSATVQNESSVSRQIETEQVVTESVQEKELEQEKTEELVTQNETQDKPKNEGSRDGIDKDVTSSVTPTHSLEEEAIEQRKVSLVSEKRLSETLPQTGEDTQSVIFGGMMSLVGALGIVLYQRKEKH